MNERILELAKISGAWDYFNDGDKSAVMDQQALQNFAIGVVKECAMIYDKIDNGNLHMGTDDYLDALRKTFWS